MSHIDNTWFSEVMAADGSAFSLKIKRKLHEEQTEYQHLEVYETETFGNLMVLDGSNMVTSRENFLYHEMLSHVPLFTHQNPKRVAIIGGGDCGTLREVLKHKSVEEVFQIDIDEGVTRASEKYFPELCESNNDPRAKLMWIDGIKWIQDAPKGSLDVIIVDSTDPVGPAVGLFAADFYKACYDALASDGVLVGQSESPLFHTASIIKQMYVDLGTAGFIEINTFPFPQPIYPTGWWSCTVAIKSGAMKNFREQDARNAGFETLYYTADLHKGALVMPPFMQKILKA
jgi:spermidine synthase